MHKKTRIFFFLFSAILFLSFAYDNPYFTITQKDVELRIPKGFPKVVYSFKDNKITPEGFVLGRKLFYDPILSKDSSVSCAFCHQRIAAFAHIDHRLSHGINGLIGKRNVPALQNLIWSKSFMWDGSINHLELQPLAPIANPVEMNMPLDVLIKKLQRNKDYTNLFQAAFSDSIVSSQHLLKALSQFLGLMISSDSRYDKYLHHEDTLSASELRGLKLFRTKCENCHKEPLFTDEQFHNTGLPPDTALKDYGRYALTGQDSDYMKFKTPSLRNVEMTYPYMHDGRFKNLQQVLDHYANGHFADPRYDKSLDRIKGLSAQEKVDIISFLKTLTDKTFLYDRRFADPNDHG